MPARVSRRCADRPHAWWQYFSLSFSLSGSPRAGQSPPVCVELHDHGARVWGQHVRATHRSRTTIDSVIFGRFKYTLRRRTRVARHIHISRAQLCRAPPKRDRKDVRARSGCAVVVLVCAANTQSLISLKRSTNFHTYCISISTISRGLYTNSSSDSDVGRRSELKSDEFLV